MEEGTSAPVFEFFQSPAAAKLEILELDFSEAGNPHFVVSNNLARKLKENPIELEHVRTLIVFFPDVNGLWLKFVDHLRFPGLETLSVQYSRCSKDTTLLLSWIKELVSSSKQLRNVNIFAEGGMDAESAKCSKMAKDFSVGSLSEIVGWRDGLVSYTTPVKCYFEQYIGAHFLLNKLRIILCVLVLR
jgi:hypothetical protein